MVRTNAQIDALNLMKDENEPNLPYETEEGVTGLTDDQIAENEKIKVEAEAKAAEEKAKENQTEGKKEVDNDEEKNRIAAEEKVKLDAEEKQKAEDAKKIEEPELDDAKVLAYLKTTKGKEFTSIDDFLNPKKELTPEEKEKITDQREANKVAYGLSKGLFNNKQYESYITDSKNPVPIALEAYVKDQQAEDSTLTEGEIIAEFNEKYGLDEDKDSRAYKTGQKLISNIALNLIHKKYPSIVSLENEYSSFEQKQKKDEEYENKYKTQSPVYKRDIENVKREIKKVSIPISDKENFEVELDDNVIDEIIGQMSADKFSKDQIERGWEKENIKQTAQTAAIIKSLPSLMKKYADQKILDQQAGVRGVKPLGKEGERAKVITLTEDQKKAIALMDEMIAN